MLFHHPHLTVARRFRRPFIDILVSRAFAQSELRPHTPPTVSLQRSAASLSHSTHSEPVTVIETLSISLWTMECHSDIVTMSLSLWLASGAPVLWGEGRRGNELSRMLNLNLSTSNHRYHPWLSVSSAVIYLIEIVLHPAPSLSLSNVLIKWFLVTSN